MLRNGFDVVKVKEVVDMKYEANALLYGEPTKFIVTVPDEVNGYMINKYQVSLLLMGKYGNDVVVTENNIIEVIEEDFRINT